MLNQVQLIGRIGRDPETKQLDGGGCVSSFSLATNERWKDKTTGEKREKTEWHRIVTFGKLAEIVEYFATKGTLVYVSGKLVTRKYQAKDDIEKQVTEIHADNFKLLSGSGGAAPIQDNNHEQKKQKSNSEEPFDNLDDDIPF